MITQSSMIEVKGRVSVLRKVAMAKIGDKVKVTITNATLGASVAVGQEAYMSVPGVIIADYGDSWLVELAISVDGKNRTLIPKAAQA